MQLFFKKNAFLPLLPTSTLKNAFLGVVWHQENESGTNGVPAKRVWHQRSASETSLAPTECPMSFPGGVWHQRSGVFVASCEPTTRQTKQALLGGDAGPLLRGGGREAVKHSEECSGSEVLRQKSAARDLECGGKRCETTLWLSTPKEIVSQLQGPVALHCCVPLRRGSEESHHSNITLFHHSMFYA